jgi:hypothetical protein
MKIKICQTNLDKINEALDQVQKRCTARTIDASDVVRMTEEVEQRLNIPKCGLAGVKFSADYHAQAFPNAYHGRPESTIILCEHNGTAWYLTDVRREDTRRPTVAYHVSLTEEAKDRILDRCSYFG